MRNRSRGRGRRRKPGPKPGEDRQPGLPPLQPVYPEERWGAGDNEYDERQPDTNASTMELSGPGAFSRRPGPPGMRREPPGPRADRPERQPREGRGEREGRGDRERGGRGGGRRRRGRGGRRDNAAAPPGEAAMPTPAVTDQSLAAALPGLAVSVPIETEPGIEPVEPAEGAAPDIAPELKPAAAPVEPRKPRGVVVLAIGLPGSGKSTWFKRRGVTPLSSDMLRNILFDNITEQRYQHLVFSTLRSLLRARLIARMPWNYVDATNLSPKERRHWIHMARGFGYETHAVFFDVPVEVCMERNEKRERVVPEDVMQRMAAKLRPPKFEEGFAKITVVRVKRAQAEAAEPGAEAAATDAESVEPVEGEEEVEE